jgi:hypothetical protein
MTGKRTKIILGLALVASVAVWLWRLQIPLRPTPPPGPALEVTNRVAVRPERELNVPPPPFNATAQFMRYELLSEQQIWGSLSLLPGFWGYATRVELPDVSPRDFLGQRLGEEVEGLFPPLAVVRWTSDWSEFLNRWLDPRLTQTRGVGFFNPNTTYEGLKLLPAPRDSGFGLGLKYRWAF